MKDRRLKTVLFAPEMLVQICKTHANPLQWLHTCDGLPDDAKFERAFVQDTPGCPCWIVLIVRSGTFENLPEGKDPPEIRVTFTEHGGE